MSKKVVVTGCAGFIGSHLTDRLLAEGYCVVGIDSFEDYYSRADKERNLESALSSPAFTLHDANILDLTADARCTQHDRGLGCGLTSLLTDCDCVYHLAAQAGVRSSWGSSFDVYARNNVLATQQLLEACVASNAHKVVYASSSSVYGDQEELPLREDMLPRPRSPYGVTKLAGEHLCDLYHANYQLDTVSLRFFTVYGPRQRPDMAFNRFIRAILEDRDIVVYGDGRQTRDFTYVDDIVEGLMLAQTAAAGTLMNIGGGNRVSLSEAIATLGDVMGVEPRLQLRSLEAGDVRDTWADVSRARDSIGFRPTTKLAAGIARECAWMRGRSAAV